MIDLCDIDLSPGISTFPLMPFLIFELTNIYNQIEKFTLGNIHAKRDWGFAGDYVEAMWSMLQQKNPDDFIISTGETHSVEEFLALATEFAGMGDWQKFVEIDKSTLRPTDIDELVGDSSKAQKQIGWKPKITFKELVKTMVEHDMNYFESLKN